VSSKEIQESLNISVKMQPRFLPDEFDKKITQNVT
jgi:hypothetical protein